MTQEIKDQLDRIEAKLDALIHALAEEHSDDDGPVNFVDMDGNQHHLPDNGPEEGLG